MSIMRTAEAVVLNSTAIDHTLDAYVCIPCCSRPILVPQQL